MNIKSISQILFFSFVLIACKQTDKNENNNPKITLSDPLPSWNDNANKKAIIDFVTKTTTEGSEDFIPVADRIACLTTTERFGVSSRCISSWLLL